MAKTYIPYLPDTVEGQAILGNLSRVRPVLRYRDRDKLIERIRRGMPLYELHTVEQVGEGGDNLLIRGECVSACAHLKAQGIELDLVYIDPPFASGADYAKQVYLRRHPRLAEQMAEAEAALEFDELRAFEEKMYGDIWNKEDYLSWMYENLMAIKSVMSDTASIYVHLDWHIGHYVKVLMDEVFGEQNFRNEIVWKRTSARSDSKTYNHIHDVVYFYSKSDDFEFNDLYIDYDDGYIKTAYRLMDEDGRRYTLSDLMASGLRNGSSGLEWRGINPASRGNHWKFTIEKLDQLASMGKIVWPTKPGGVPRYKRYLDEMKGIPLQSIWDDIFQVGAQAGERVEYATQKPEALLERIIKASSHAGMMVADFFGGSGVTAKVAHDLGRRFIHADVGVNSLQTARDRLRAAGASFTVLDVQDGVSLFRNPVQTMDKLKAMIPGLRNEDALDSFWEGALMDSRLGVIPVYLPNLLDHGAKLLDTVQMNRLIHEAMPDLPDTTKKVVVYFVDIDDRDALEDFMRNFGPPHIEIELRDLKILLDEIVLEDEIEWTLEQNRLRITRFASDRLRQKIDEYNQKRALGSKPHKPIELSDDGLELIEWLSLDCTNSQGPWQADAEVKIDKYGYVTLNGQKTKAFWDGSIAFERPPLRLKLRNIAGDETLVSLSATR